MTPPANPSLFGGIKIVESLHWPQVQDGTREVRSTGHPIIYWISRQLARVGVRYEPDVVWQVPRYRWADPMYDRTRGVLYCHPGQVAQIRAAIQPSKDTP